MVAYVITSESNRSVKHVFTLRQACIDRLTDLMHKAGVDEPLEVVDSFDPHLDNEECISDVTCRKIKLLKQADIVYTMGDRFYGTLIDTVVRCSHYDGIPSIDDGMDDDTIIYRISEIKKGENNNA